MPRLTPEEHEGYMQSIMGMFENPDDGAEMIGRLRDDYNSSLEVADTVAQSEYDELNGKYTALREKYIERFFGGEAGIEGAKADQRKDIEADKKGELTFEGVAESYLGKDV